MLLLAEGGGFGLPIWIILALIILFANAFRKTGSRR